MLKVYLVDDEQPIIDELLKVIDWSGLGYEICGYANKGETALCEVIEKQPHLLICDIHMTGMNGLELAEEIAKRKLPTEVILLTAYDLFDYAVQAIKLKVRSYLIKPVNKRELNTLLQNFRKERCNKTLDPLFDMLINGEVDEKIIKRTEKKCKELGFFQTEKKYAFAFIETDETLDYTVAEYKTENGKYLLIELLENEPNEESSILYSTKFRGAENFFKYAKEIVTLSKYTDMDEQTQKDIKVVIQKIIEDIEREYSQKISFSFYAERYHYNLSYLSKQFKIINGMNFVDWLFNVRLNKAKQFMKDESLTLHEIALKVGYEDYSHFCKVFKKSEGISPQEYRTNYC